MPTLRLISQKLCLLVQKNTGTWDVNTVRILVILSLMIPIKNPIPGIMVLWMFFNKILNFVIEQRGQGRVQDF